MKEVNKRPPTAGFLFKNSMCALVDNLASKVATILTFCITLIKLVSCDMKLFRFLIM